jgi:hypothetical protein
MRVSWLIGEPLEPSEQSGSSKNRGQQLAFQTLNIMLAGL